MIYIHDDSKVTTYTEISGINAVLDYTCGSIIKGVNLTDIHPLKHCIFLGPSKEYIDEVLKRQEAIEALVVDYSPVYGFKSHTIRYQCVQTGEGLYTWFGRHYCIIDWMKDYHFFTDSDVEKRWKEEQRNK